MGVVVIYTVGEREKGELGVDGGTKRSLSNAHMCSTHTDRGEDDEMGLETGETFGSSDVVYACSCYAQFV